MTWGLAVWFLDPHIHMYCRTTDDYAAMYERGIRAVVEPSFWLGSRRRYAGSFFDYFLHILEFEAARAERFGIEHYAMISVNPKEADDWELARETLDGLGPYLDHERCVGVGEVGFYRITPNEERVFQAQLELAKQRGLLILVHTPRERQDVSKRKGVERTMDILREFRYDAGRIVVDHNTDETLRLVRSRDVWVGLSLHPYAGLSAERIVETVRRWGLERVLISSSADWSVSDPLGVPKVADRMAARGFKPADIERLLFENPMAFLGQSPRFKPRFVSASSEAGSEEASE